MQGGPVLKQDLDKNGAFHFSDLTFMDNSSFVLRALDAKGGNYAHLVYDKDMPEPVVGIATPEGAQNQPMVAYLENRKKQQDETVQYGDIKGKILKEVVIKDKKIIHYPSNGNLISPGMANQLITGKDLEKVAATSLKAKISQLFYGQGSTAGLIVVDGMAMPLTFIDMLNFNDVETVGAVYGTDASIYGGRGLKGVWIITIKQGKGIVPRDIASIGVLSITPQGYYKAREFYAPKYDHTENSFNREDLRSTIYWKPELVTDKDGNASFDYYNADGTGSYRVVVEGMDANGSLGRQVYRYKVE
jgi:hypothetical protein